MFQQLGCPRWGFEVCVEIWEFTNTLTVRDDKKEKCTVLAGHLWNIQRKKIRVHCPSYRLPHMYSLPHYQGKSRKKFAYISPDNSIFCYPVSIFSHHILYQIQSSHQSCTFWNLLNSVSDVSLQSKAHLPFLSVSLFMFTLSSDFTLVAHYDLTNKPHICHDLLNQYVIYSL